MTLSVRTDESTASLFPDTEDPPDRGRHPDLRKAGSLLDVRAGASLPGDASAPGIDFRTGDLFAWGARQQQIKLRSPSSARGGTHRGLLHRPTRARPRARSAYRLARCLDGGRINSPFGEYKRRVQRNRILFLAVFFALALFIIARLLFGG